MAGPSGFEHPVAEQAAELMRPFLDEANVDRFGNAVGVRLCGKPGAPRLLLDAHLDEIGLMVTGVEDGFLRFRTIGGVDPRMLPDRELTDLSAAPCAQAGGYQEGHPNFRVARRYRYGPKRSRAYSSHRHSYGLSRRMLRFEERKALRQIYG